MSNRLCAPLAVLAGSALLWAGCLSEADTGRESTALEDGCTRLGATLLSHACFHAEFGPFVTVAASPTRDFAAASPNITAVHTLYTVTLPGAPGANEGTVKYRPARSGDWAILTSPEVPVLVLDSAGTSVPVSLRHDVVAAECSRLAAANVVQLTGGQTYRVVFGPSSAGSVGVVLEKLSDFEAFVFADADGDGFGDPENGRSTACTLPASHVADDTDCDDTRAQVHPGAAELCDQIDNDCDGEVDEEAEPGRFHPDADGDGHGNPAVTVEACTTPAGHVADGTDCDDADATVFPGAIETCDGRDNDCDAATDEDGTASAFYRDGDGDGIGDPAVTQVACTAPAGFVPISGDCDDADAAVFPGAAEICDGRDNDCDGTIDDDAGTRVYADGDGDGFGNVEVSVVACVAPPGHVADGSDCDDTDPEVNPEEHEVCDGLDNDCDGAVDNLPDPIGEVVEHACLHAQHGPFTTVDAAAPGASGAPDVSAPHTAFHVNLVAAGGAFSGELAFTPDETTDVAILVDPDVPVVVLDAGGDPIEIEEERAITTCPALARASVLELEGGVTYRLQLGPATAAQALLLIEEVAHEHDDDGDHDDGDGGAIEFFADGDGDGFGDPAASVTACAAPAGHVANGSDCDDASASVHPDAPEVCDGADNDCDGLVDEVDGQSVCACDDVVVEASRSYCPSRRDDGLVLLGGPTSVAIPVVLPVTRGNAGNQHATLQLRVPGSSAEIRCTYRGGASRLHPVDPADLERGRRYELRTCTGGRRAGDLVETDRISLRIDGGDAWRGTTSVRAELDTASCR